MTPDRTSPLHPSDFSANGLGGLRALVAVQQPLFTEMFEPSFRYSGAGFAYQLASAVAGGFTPIIAAELVIQNGGGYTYVALYLAGACLISMVTGLLYGGPQPFRAPDYLENAA